MSKQHVKCPSAFGKHAVVQHRTDISTIKNDCSPTSQQHHDTKCALKPSGEAVLAGHHLPAPEKNDLMLSSGVPPICLAGGMMVMFLATCQFFGLSFSLQACTYFSEIMPANLGEDHTTICALCAACRLLTAHLILKPNSSSFAVFSSGRFCLHDRSRDLMSCKR